jgi:hypothetical protein
MSTTDRIEARLIIKGNSIQAIKAAEDHRLPLVIERGTHRETVGVTYATAAQLNRWFLEDTNPPPFPTGSLLLWTPID